MIINKTSLFLSILVFIVSMNIMANDGELKEIFLDNEDAQSFAFDEWSLLTENNNRNQDVFNLQRGKFKLISGDLRAAEFYFNRINDKSVLSLVKKRYLSTLYFIKGDLEKSLEIISHPEFNEINHYKQICLLRVLGLITSKETKNLKSESEKCIQFTSSLSKNDQFWLDTMVKLKLQDQIGIKKNLITDAVFVLKDDELARLWLKTGLYLNKEKELLDLLSLLPESSYQSKKLREIIAFMYLRKGDNEKALAFIDDVDSANAENIKGNIRLSKKEYELAFGHFQLALQKKQDSNNSLERAIPLAWLLGQWKDGLTMLNNISNKSLDKRNKKALEIAFLIREQKYTEAKNELTLLKIEFQNEAPLEVNIMDTYVQLALGEKMGKFDKRAVEEASEKACKSFDGMSCWITLQYIHWDNLGKTAKRNEPVFSNKDLSIDSLKTKKTIVPLNEIATIDQADIEELDGETINIQPRN